MVIGGLIDDVALTRDGVVERGESRVWGDVLDRGQDGSSAGVEMPLLYADITTDLAGKISCQLQDLSQWM